MPASVSQKAGAPGGIRLPEERSDVRENKEFREWLAKKGVKTAFTSDAIDTLTRTYVQELLKDLVAPALSSGSSAATAIGKIRRFSTRRRSRGRTVTSLTSCSASPTGQDPQRQLTGVRGGNERQGWPGLRPTP